MPEIGEERGLPLDGLHFHGAGWQAHLEDLGRSLGDKPSEWKARWTERPPANKTRTGAHRK